MGEKPNYDSSCFNGGDKIFHVSHERKKWQEAESKLRTFEIDLPSSKIHSSIWIGDHWKYQLDLSQQFSIHQAEILPNGKVRII